MLRRPYAGKHQQLGRRNTPSAQNDLVTFYREPLLTAVHFHTYGTSTVKQDAPGCYVSPDGEVKPVAGLAKCSVSEKAPGLADLALP